MVLNRQLRLLPSWSLHSRVRRRQKKQVNKTITDCDNCSEGDSERMKQHLGGRDIYSKASTCKLRRASPTTWEEHSRQISELIKVKMLSRTI